MRRYERARRRRTARVQRAARRNGAIYHLVGAEALLRNLALRRPVDFAAAALPIGSMIGASRPQRRIVDALPAARPGEE